MALVPEELMVERFRDVVTCPSACQADRANLCRKDAGGSRRISKSAVIASTVCEAVLPQ
jgi:hypothetical protein